MRAMMLLSAAALVLLLAVGFKFSRAGYESPAYRVGKKDGAFEIRLYPTLQVASTPMDGPDPENGDSFLRLFRYISGANAAETKIAMTTPVLMTLGEDGETMSFIAPRRLAESGAPPASDQSIRIETVDGGRFAAYRYSGRWDRQRTEEARQRLADWVRQQGLEIVGAPIFAGYDPPFTPPFLRRNEVLVRLAQGARQSS